MLSGKEIRKKFVQFFMDKQHKYYESASLIPDDPTLLLTVAGMVPFKPFFMGQKEAPHPRITTYQKCIRTNDLDNVGRTTRHHTFFEMLGNFSFGDYFKKEAILWSWEFVTEVLKLSKETLWISVFHEDEESIKIWNEKAGVPLDRIVKLGEEDNFWSAGPTGSCGPCSEIYVDTGVDETCTNENCAVGCDCDRYLEIWNLVFTESNRLEDGTLEPLPKKNIDTGAGLERIASVIQGAKTNFDNDLLLPIVQKVCEIIGVEYKREDKTDFSIRVIADHIRAITFLINDGVLPTNDGRGYVLRRILRRAARHGRLLGMNEIFLYKLLDIVISIMGEAYPELDKSKAHIEKIMKIEEEKFSHTLDQGMLMVNEEIEKIKKAEKNKISPELSFKLYDTYGFPFELTEEICIENNIEISFEEFQVKMKEQKDKARNAREVVKEQGQDDFIETFYDKYGKTEFRGYETIKSEAIIYNIKKLDSKKYEIIFNKTPFYAESGGQASDFGIIEGSGLKGKVVDVKKQKEIFMHTVIFEEGEDKLKKGLSLNLKVDKYRRDEIKRNHTATHLLQKALKEVLGDHVHQAGSLVTDDRLRFDFAHYQAVSREELEKIAMIVNQKIFDNIELDINHMSLDEAKEKGAMALFGDKYGELVRVVDVPGYCMELCGGIHVERTGEIGLFNIISETGIAAGVRRIEATSGYTSYKVINELQKEVTGVCELLKTDSSTLLDKVSKTLEQLKQKQKEIDKLKSKISTYEAGNLFDEVEEINGIKVLIKDFKDKEASSLRDIIDKAKDKLASCIVILGTDNGKAIFAVGVTKDLLSKAKAGDIVREVAKKADGNGGGRPDFAQAGGKSGNKVKEALEFAKEFLKEKL